MAIRLHRRQKIQNRHHHHHRPLPLLKNQSRPNLQLKLLWVGASHLTVCWPTNVCQHYVSVLVLVWDIWFFYLSHVNAEICCFFVAHINVLLFFIVIKYVYVYVQRLPTRFAVNAFKLIIPVLLFCVFFCILCLQCFDTFGWAAGRASGL